MPFNLGEELIVDNFCGGGGASSGIEQAVGRPIDIAINHSPEAIRMHTVNHPHTKHYCESVWDVDPEEACQGRPVGLAWFSPDCKHFSKAKGSKPVEKKIRGLAWVAVRWAATVRPRVIILENVEEFKTWGPLIVGQDGYDYPCKDRKGHTFNAFKQELEKLGYRVEHKELRACDYGAPTIRKRLFLVARCDGLPIVWPEATHGPGLAPYKTAADIIDWSLPCPSIFERSRPLAENTLRRIARGMQRFVIDSPNPFIVRIGQTGFGKDRLQYSIDDPLTTITTKAEHCLVVPAVSAFLAKHYTGVVGQSMEKPVGTITGIDHHSLVTSHLIKLRGTCKDGQPVTEPLPTLTAGGNHVGEVRAFLIKYYSQGGQWQDLSDPLHTIPSKARMGLVMVHGQPYRIADIGMRMLQPPELYAGQGFSPDYIFDQSPAGLHVRQFSFAAQCRRFS
jgi:DNA (cytosine-5)-methyltransferase 1